MLARLRAVRTKEAPIDSAQFRDLEAFCFFLGYPRSGHSLIGSCLDAHSDVVIAHEADVLKMHAKNGWSRDRIFQAIVDNSAEQASRATGRTQSGYIYEVPGQWQGRSRRLRVIGDKGGGEGSRRLAADPSELRKFIAHIGLPTRVLHITRNPFDVIARIARVTRKGQRKQTLDEALLRFEVLAVTNAGIIDSGQFDILTLRHEDFVSDAATELRKLCEFVGVDADDDYVAACAGIVWEKPHRTRELVEWSDEQIAKVESIIASHDFLAGYSLAPIS